MKIAICEIMTFCELGVKISEKWPALDSP
jgi:hypothetical protein